MLKVKDEVIIIGNVFEGYEGVVIEFDNDAERVRVKLKNDVNDSMARWFNIQSVKLLEERRRSLYIFRNNCGDLIHCKLTKEQEELLDFLCKNNIDIDFQYEEVNIYSFEQTDEKIFERIYKVLDSYGDATFCKVTEEQERFLHYLYEKEIILDENDIEKIDVISIDEP